MIIVWIFLKNYINNFLVAQKTKVRFIIAGAFNTVIGLATYPLLYLVLVPYGQHYMTILVISTIISIVTAFLTNKFFVFKTTGNYIKEFGRFSLFHLTHVIINFAALPFMVEYMEMNPMWAQPLFAIIVIASSYLWHKNITFLHK